MELYRFCLVTIVISQQGISSLHWACSTGNYEAVQVLMSAGAYPNHMEVDGERLTPLDYAIIGGHQDIAQYLIEQNSLTISGIKELAASLIQVGSLACVVRSS